MHIPAESLVEHLVGIRHSLTMERVMRPDGCSWHIRRIPRAQGVEIVAFDERIVDNDRTATPGRMPTPSAPTVPTPAEEVSDADADAEEDAGTHGWIIPTRIGVIDSRSPNPCWIVNRHVDDFGISRENLDNRLARFGRRDHLLLRSRNQIFLTVPPTNACAESQP